MKILKIIIFICVTITFSLYSPTCKAQDIEDTAVTPPPPPPPPTTTTTGNDATDKPPVERPERVTVLAPRNLRPNSDYHILVNLANSQVPASIDLQITGARDSNREQIEAKSILANSGETQTVKFTIGDWQSAEYILSVNAQAVDRSWNFTQETPLIYQAKTFSGFIQTDKAIYKPGQLVQFRAILLSQTLTPIVLKDQINVTVSDPKRNIIKQWINQSNYRGLLSLDLQLSEDPVFGDWNVLVEAKNQQFSKQFRVAEYILPTFDVDIQLPSYATYNESDIVATVKASYTYGKPVNGHVTLTVQPLVRFSYLDTRPLHQNQYRARLVDGSADINLNLAKGLNKDLFEREIEFFALVEEDLTGRTYNKTKFMKIHDKSIEIKRINAEERFKPGLSYHLKLKVAYQDDTPVENNGPELELKYRSLGDTLEKVKLRPVNGIADHLITIPKKIKSNQVSDRMYTPRFVDLEVNYRGQTYYLEGIYAFFSKSEEYMQVSLPQLLPPKRIVDGNSFQQAPVRSSPIVNVGDDLKIRVEATEPMQQVTCQGLARGDIVWALSRESNNQTEFEFNVKVDQRMTPEATILCFYIRPDNKELIADSKSVPVNGLIKNVVKLSTSREEAKPGQEVEVSVFTKPNSLVGLLGIDQSVLLLKTGNDISQKDLSDEMKSYGSLSSRLQNNIEGAKNADQLFSNSGVVILTNNLVYNGYGFLEARLLYSGNAYARNSLNDQLAPAKLQLESAILEHQLNPPEFHLKKTKVDPPVIRTFFPETWFWENSTSGSDGIANFKAKAPDTITSWVLSAFSINENFGFGLTNQKSSVRVFRPFFIKLNLPYSIIRGETVSIQAIIFNYSKRPTQAKVVLENNNDEFEFVSAANDIEDEKRSSKEFESRIISIPAQDGISVSFLIKPKKLGNIAIKVLAQSEFAADGVIKKLLVKPEGQTQYLNKAFLINLPGPQTRMIRNFSIDVPINAVPDSQKVSVAAVGDIIGPGLSNVDDLLRLPYGCGEQNMINLVPNIVILNYLKKTKRLREVQRTKAIKNIESGYQRQLNYKRNDGSFSAFGNSDPVGSVWLTAYVLKTLQQAKEFVTVDEMVIRKAANFIASHSKPDGSIDEVGMIHDKRLQSSIAGSSATTTYLTAYSMISLLQKPINPSGDAPSTVALDEVLDKGLNYLVDKLDVSYSNDNPYELIAIAYTLNLANRQPAMDEAYEKMWLKAQENGEFIWWEDKSESLKMELAAIDSSNNAKLSTSSEQQQPPPLKVLPENKKHSAHSFIPDSLSIEMTSLALLTTIKRGELERAFPIVKWLISKQNSRGGFVSTQDTILAIEALAAFAETSVASNAPLSIDIDILFPRNSRQQSALSGIRRNNIEQLLISRNNALVHQQIKLPDNTTWVQVQATGAGTAVVQVSWQYNLLVSAEQPAFYLNPILDKTSNINYLQLSVCTFYKAGEASNMAVMEVELPSGYVADVEALPGLKRTRDIKRIDTADGDTKVIIYFDKITKDEICLTVPAHRTSKVSNNRPVPVSIYDYYNRQQAARIFYEPDQASSCDICDHDTCSELCTSKPKKSEKLLSLHEQRKINRSADLIQPPPITNSTSSSSPSSKNGSILSYQMLPLAPVMATLIAFTRNLTHPSM